MLSLTFACGNSAQHNQNYFGNEKEKASILHFLDSLNFHSNQNFIFIDKSDYRLYVMRDTSVLHDYPVVFGPNPTDQKLQEGDGCTPEGIFKIRDKYPHKRWTKFMWIDYPNQGSWKKFNEAKRSETISSTSQIGGEVGIHGVPAGMDYLINTKYNWTAGCISLKNDDVNVVYEFVKKETAVIIRK